MKRYILNLTEDERAALEEVGAGEQRSFEKVRCAQGVTHAGALLSLAYAMHGVAVVVGNRPSKGGGMESQPLTASLNERLDENEIAQMQAVVNETSPAKTSTSKLRIADRVSERLGRRYVSKLATREGRKNAMKEVPEREHIVAKQSKLALEFVEDVVSGEYRDGRWRSVFILAGVVLYSLNPADVVPDWLPLIGSIDDLLVSGLATRGAQAQLKEYARAKGYPVEEYFA